MLDNEELLFDELYEKTKDCGRTQFIKLLMQKERENQELKKINEEHKKLNGNLRKENQEIRLDQTKKVFHVLTHVLLNGGCTYKYLIYDLLDFKPENYSDLIEGMNIVNAIATLEELKEQVENYKKDIYDLDKQRQNAFENMQLNQLNVCNKARQQKEFIKYLENEIKIYSNTYMGEMLKELKEILQKYKSIIGVSDENN